MDSKELFTRKSEDYALFRPSYPAAAVEWLAEKTSAVTVADIGLPCKAFQRNRCR